MNGTPQVGKHFFLKIDGSTMVHTKTFSITNAKGEIDVTSRDSSGDREYVLDGVTDKTLSFSAGVVRKGTQTNGKSFTELLTTFYDSDASMGFSIVPDLSSNFTITGTGYLTTLDIDFSDPLSEITCTGNFRINTAAIGTAATDYTAS